MVKVYVKNKILEEIKQKKAPTRFEEALKAKAKLSLFDIRQKIIENLEVKVPTDKNGEIKPAAIDFLKLQFIATQGLGEIGDKARPTKKALKGLQRLYGKYLLAEATYGTNHPLTKVYGALLFQAFTGLLNRSVRREHTNVEVVIPPAEMFLPYWMQPPQKTLRD